MGLERVAARNPLYATRRRPYRASCPLMLSGGPLGALGALRRSGPQLRACRHGLGKLRRRLAAARSAAALPCACFVRSGRSLSWSTRHIAVVRCGSWTRNDNRPADVLCRRRLTRRCARWCALNAADPLVECRYVIKVKPRIGMQADNRKSASSSSPRRRVSRVVCRSCGAFRSTTDDGGGGPRPRRGGSIRALWRHTAGFRYDDSRLTAFPWRTMTSLPARTATALPGGVQTRPKRSPSRRYRLPRCCRANNMSRIVRGP